MVTIAGCAGNDTSADADVDIDPDPAATTPAIDETTAPPTDATTTAPIDTTVASKPAPTPTPTPADASDNASRDATTLRIGHSLDGDVLGFFDEIIAEFEAEHPGIDVESTRYEGGYTAGLEQLAALDEADRPNVFMGSNSSIRLQHDSGLFVPPSECTGGEMPDALRDLLPIIERTHTVDGTLVAVPYSISTPVMMYDLLRANIEAPGGSTLHTSASIGDVVRAV